MDVIKNAVLSNDEKYRTVLSRQWDETLSILLVCMLNPSTADAEVDDQTITVLCNAARKFRYGGIIVVNLYSFRSTTPSVLWDQWDPIGEDNDAAIEWAAQVASAALLAWGGRGCLDIFSPVARPRHSNSGNQRRSFSVTSQARAFLALPIARVKMPERPIHYCAGYVAA